MSKGELKQLRFAPLVRVSTEGQAAKGESLRTQRKQIEHAVRSLNGVIPPHCWAYSGQEHATPENERRLLEALLNDATKGVFDAVIVCDASRWSRDNAKSKDGLKILKSNDIKFFIGSTEWDLSRPDHRLYLGMAAEIGEFHAAEQTRKSMENKIERAKRGIPTGGKLPYGRLFKDGQWILDKDAVKGIQYAANEYLKGGNLVEIARKLGVCAANLWKVLTKRSGDTWQIKFESKALKINQVVEFKIPRLLPQATIDKILVRCQANKTYTRGSSLNRYLLGRMVFCASCGGAMSGMTKENNKQYYRHAQRERKGQPCNNRGFQRVPAEELENAVIAHLFGMFGDKLAIERAIESAIPKVSEIPQIESSIVDLNAEIVKAGAAIGRVIGSIEKGIISDDEAITRLYPLRERKTILTQEIAILQQKLTGIPEQKEIKDRARELMIQVGKARARIQNSKDAEHLDEMTYESKRALIEAAFAGLDVEGRRFGIYVSKGSDGVKWNFTIKGILPEEYFGEIVGHLPMSKERKDMLIGKFDPADGLLPEDFAGGVKQSSSRRCRTGPGPRCR